MAVNVIELLWPLFSKGWNIRDDGMIEPDERRIAPDRPFTSANLVACGYDCLWEMDVLFEVVHRMEAVPVRCLSCYKVLLAPTTLEDVFWIEKFQQTGPHPCKVGMEIRPTVKRPWGAYWYTNSVEEGRERFRLVEGWAQATLKGKWSMLLKRGCTEYEQALGPSDRWKEIPGQAEKEEAVRAAVVHQAPQAEQSRLVVDHIHEQWRKWDKIMQPYVTYHGEKKEEARRRKQLEARKIVRALEADDEC